LIEARQRLAHCADYFFLAFVPWALTPDTRAHGDRNQDIGSVRLLRIFISLLVAAALSAGILAATSNATPNLW
jgi:hypothetical protein